MTEDSRACETMYLIHSVGPGGASDAGVAPTLTLTETRATMRPHLSAYLAAALAFIAMAIPRHGVAQASGSQQPPARTDTGLDHRSGLYLSAADFQRARLEHPIDCRTARHVIDRHTVLRNSYIDVEHEGQRFRHEKRDIFGYRDCDGRDIRFVEGAEYEVVEAGPVYIYTSERIEHRGRPYKRVTVFSFSVTPDSALLTLTAVNLKRAYPSERRFPVLIDAAAQRGDDLSAYDDVHKTYRINLLFTQAR